MIEEDPQEEQDTSESAAVEPAAVEPAPVTFEPEDTEAVGDAAAASLDVEASAAEPAAFAGQSPIEADRRGAEQAEDPPIVAIVGAFVGAFVAAKLLGRLGGGDD